MRLVFPSLSLELPSPLLPALLDSHEQLLEVALCTKATFLGPVVRLCAADRAISPVRSCSRNRALFLWLKIFRVRNFRGLSQSRKYYSNENFPNYGRLYHPQLHTLNINNSEKAIGALPWGGVCGQPSASLIP